MASQFSGKRQYTNAIKVMDKVCRLSNDGWVVGRIVEIKEKRAGRQKFMVSTYILKYDDAPTTCVTRDFEATSELVHFNQQKILGQAQLTMTNHEVLGVVGVTILTKWTLQLHQVAGGAEPPQWLVDMEPAFIRKCKIKKFHTVLRQFELVYTCGYARFVPIADMLEILNTHHLYCQSDNSKIRLSVQKAEEEWNLAHDPSLCTRLQKAVSMEHGQSVTTTDARSTRSRKRTATALLEGRAVIEQSGQEDTAPVETAIEFRHDDEQSVQEDTVPMETAIDVLHDDEQGTDKPSGDANPTDKGVNGDVNNVTSTPAGDVEAAIAKVLHDKKDTTKDPAAVETAIAVVHDEEQGTNKHSGYEIPKDKGVNGDVNKEMSAQDGDVEAANAKVLHYINATVKDTAAVETAIVVMHDDEQGIDKHSGDDIPKVKGVHGDVNDDTAKQDGDVEAAIAKLLHATNVTVKDTAAVITAIEVVHDDEQGTNKHSGDESPKDNVVNGDVTDETSKQDGAVEAAIAKVLHAKKDTQKETDAVDTAIEDVHDDEQDTEKRSGDETPIEDNADQPTQTPMAPSMPPAWFTPEMLTQLIMNQVTTLTKSMRPQTTTKSEHKEVKVVRAPKQTRKETKQRSNKKQKTSATDVFGGTDDDSFETTTSENSYRRLNWQKGRQDWSRPSKLAAEIKKVTVETLPEIYPTMRKHGWAILRDSTQAFAPKARFTREQRDYIHQFDIGENALEVVFEGVVVNSKVDHYVPHFSDAESDNPRVQMARHSIGAAYTTQYQEQLRNIIEGYDVFVGDEEPVKFDQKATKAKAGSKRKTNNSASDSSTPELLRHVPGMFPKGTDRGSFCNWKAAHNTIKGGEGYQHAHSDQGRYDEFDHLHVFPFVAIHGFGVESFKLWVLPQPDRRTFGFLHTFEPLNMVFMRGDFVHAGAVGTNPRGHMEFFPTPKAGWTRPKSWWNQKNPGIPPTFLFQKPTFPFAFPYASTPDALTGDVVLTYPTDLTQKLLVPLTDKQCIEENIEYVPETLEATRKRKQACSEIQAHTW